MLESQVQRRDPVALRYHQGTSYTIDQLAHVAWPVVACDRAQCGVGKPRNWLRAFVGKQVAEVLGKNDHVIASRTQRRHGQRKDRETVEQVQAERSGCRVPFDHKRV